MALFILVSIIIVNNFGVNLMNLTELSIKHKTDKWGVHFYTPHYESHFSVYKDKPIVLLEIGIGGIADPYLGGNSLRVWSEWFTHPDTVIIGIDIYEKLMHFDDPRVKVYQGNQIDKEFLEGIHKSYGDFDIVLDDGSHRPEHVIETFGILFSKVKDGGMYVIEDTQTSYWDGVDSNGKRAYNPENPTYSYFKNIPDWINYAEIPVAEKPNYLEMHTVGVHFYHNLILIDKDFNSERSNGIPSRLDKAETAERMKTPILFIDEYANIGNLGLTTHIGGIGDVVNENIPSIITDGKRPYFIQGFIFTCADSAIKDAIEYRARNHTGSWGDWVTCNSFVGTRGSGKSLTGFSVRLSEQLKAKYKLMVIGAFENAEGFVVVGDGEDCVAETLNNSIYGIQIIFQPI